MKITIALQYQVKDSNEIRDFHSEFTYNSTHHLSLSPGVFLSLGIRTKEKSDWEPDMNFSISPNDIYEVQSKMKKSLELFRDQKVYYRENGTGKLKVYADRPTMTIASYNSNFIKLEPIIYTSPNDETEYQGMRIYINKVANSVDLPIQPFESLVYIISQIDLFQYSQLLLNYVSAYYGNQNRPIKKINRLEFKPVESVSEVSSTYVQPKKDMRLFEGLE